MPIGPRVTKEEFMNALGLSPQDEPYYRAMRVYPPPFHHKHIPKVHTY